MQNCSYPDGCVDGMFPKSSQYTRHTLVPLTAIYGATIPSTFKNYQRYEFTELYACHKW